MPREDHAAASEAKSCAPRVEEAAVDADAEGEGEDERAEDRAAAGAGPGAGAAAERGLPTADGIDDEEEVAELSAAECRDAGVRAEGGDAEDD